jgi:hypothetical protein
MNSNCQAHFSLSVAWELQYGAHSDILAMQLLLLLGLRMMKNNIIE